MLPSRGLRPAQFVPLSSRQCTILRPSSSRKFSSLPRTSSLPTSSTRASPLQSARWRAGRPTVVLTASSVRHGSWYAPWSWGKPNTPAGDATASGAQQVPVAEFVNGPASHYIEPAVTSATPEIAPAGIDKAPVVNTSSGAASSSPTDSLAAELENPKTMDDLLGLEPVQDTKADFDPTALVDHAGQLKELGLDYGWGVTTLFEKTIEQVYLNSGWGWAGSIVVAGVAVRCITFYFQAMSSDKMAAMAAMKPVTAPIQEKLDDAIKRGDKQQEQLLRMQQAAILKPYMGGVFSMGGFMFVQMWIGFSVFRCLRAMAELPVPGMAHDGFLWFTDLTARDPYFLLPAATTAIMYKLFKAGGETGVTDMAGGAQRQAIMTGLACLFGVITAFQASALQLYFLVSGILGAGTSFLLRQNWFRRAIRIRTIPSKQSMEAYSEVVKGNLRLKDIKGKDGKVRYQAPRAPTKPARRTAATLSSLNIKAGTQVPAHLQLVTPKVTTTSGGQQDREEDFEDGAKGTSMEKLDYYRRNYRLAFMWRRFSNGLASTARKLGFGGDEKSERKRAAERYEAEKKRRLEGK